LIFKKLQWLSLDIVLGGAIFFVFVSKQFLHRLDIGSILSFTSAMWCVYTLDHLIDVRSINQTENERRLFFIKNERLLRLVLYVVLIIGLIAVFSISLQELFFGLMLGIGIMGYLFFQRLIGRVGLKEVVIAGVYSIAIFSQVLLFSTLETHTILIFFQLWMIALLNLMIISIFELEDDTIEGFNSVATQLGKNGTRRLVSMLIFISLSFAVFRLFSFQDQTALQIFFILSSIILSIILMLPDYFRQNHYYRILADGIFFLPVFFKSFWS